MTEEPLVLKQQDAKGNGVAVRLLQGRELQIVNLSGKSRQSYAIDIVSLQEHGRLQWQLAWPWLLLAILGILFMLVALQFLPANKTAIPGVLLFGGILLSLTALLLFFRNSARKVVFCTRKAGIPVVSLYASRPNRTACRQFVQQLEQRIGIVRQHLNISEQRQLTGEIRMLRRLRDSNVIAEKVYAHARDTLLAGFDRSPVKNEAQ